MKSQGKDNDLIDRVRANSYFAPIHDQLEGVIPPILIQLHDSPGRYVLKIHFFIESGLKMIQFKIQFKTKSGIFIQEIFIQ